MGNQPKPFVLFICHTYYPLGGVLDASGVFATLEDARAAVAEARNAPLGYAHVLDLHTGLVWYVAWRGHAIDEPPEHITRSILKNNDT
jgi:hypothetical protein